MTLELPFEGTYPSDADFWVDPADATAYPYRYGDLFACPQAAGVEDSKGKPWRAVMALHPSCELGDKGAPDGIQVLRVHRLREVGQSIREQIRTGFRTTERGVAPARVNLIYLAPPPGVPDSEEMFADLRKTARVPADALETAGRLAAMSHDARLAVLRRDIYFRYRWDLPTSELLRMEAGRIASDSAFRGPKPRWSG